MTGIDPGLRPGQQEPASAVARIDADQPPTDLWHDLFAVDAIRDGFVQACRKFARDRTTIELYDALEERDIPVHLWSQIRAVALGDRRRAWHLAADVVPLLGQGWTTVEDVIAAIRLFEVLPSTPTIAVRVGQDFQNRRRGQREDICRLLGTLAKGFDVRLVMTGVTRAWLAREHRADLPGVSEWRSTNPDRTPPTDCADDALATLDPNGRAVSILRRIAEPAGETVTYHTLYADAYVDKSRVRQVIKHLADLGLVEPFGPSSDRRVELLEAGREVLSALPRQTTLDGAVSSTPQHHQQAVYHADGRIPPGDGPDEEPPESDPYRIRYLSQPGHIAAAACAPNGGVGLVRAPLNGEDDAEQRRTHLVNYDEDRDEAVVSVRATGPLQYAVSVATALASPRLVDDALPVDRLETIEDPPAILRDARCIGGLSSEAEDDPQVLRDNLVEWGEEIEDLTRDLHRGQYDDRARFRGEILRSAHGLAGTIVHLLDVAGVDVVREVRVPGSLDLDHLDELAKSIGISAMIQSRYGAFAAYRQLFEIEDQPRPPLSPDVDAADPLGTLIGGFVVRGPDIHRIRPSLADHVGTPRDLADDAPEFAVHVPIREVGRPAFATAVMRILRAKNLKPTREAISVVHALVGSPHDVARALHQLSPEEHGRDVRLDEVRYALGTLSADRILPDLPPTAGAIVAVLLAADDRLLQTDLADRADVSPQSIRRHQDRLTSLGLVDRDEGGYRLAISFRTGEERRNPVTPDTPVRFIDVVSDLLAAALPPERYADPEDPVAGALFAPLDPWGAMDDPDLAPWVALAGALTGAEHPDREVSVSVGPPIQQTSLKAADPGRRQPPTAEGS